MLELSEYKLVSMEHIWYFIRFMVFYMQFELTTYNILSPRGNIVDRGGAEVDNTFRGVTIYHAIP